jgi:hypothetical protein
MVHDNCHDFSSAVLDFSLSGTVQHTFQLDTPFQEVVREVSGVC